MYYGERFLRISECRTLVDIIVSVFNIFLTEGDGSLYIG